MKFTLTIDMDNAAYEGRGRIELRDNLQVVREAVRRSNEGLVRDHNGNTVGRWEISE